MMAAELPIVSARVGGRYNSRENSGCTWEAQNCRIVKADLHNILSLRRV